MIKMKDNLLLETNSDTDVHQESDDDLRSRLDKLERESQEKFRLSEQRVIVAELKVEAMRAGIVDLDGLRLLDTDQIRLDENGNVAGGAELIKQLKQAKPWLFAAPWSSSVAKVPQSRPAQQKLAKDMSEAEYRIARANIVKRSVF
jgi:hypothetical protein